MSLCAYNLWFLSVLVVLLFAPLFQKHAKRGRSVNDGGDGGGVTNPLVFILLLGVVFLFIKVISTVWRGSYLAWF